MADSGDHLGERLRSISEELADAGMSCLRAALDAGDETERARLGAEERRLARARRAVDKAAALLAPPEPRSG